MCSKRITLLRQISRSCHNASRAKRAVPLDRKNPYLKCFCSGVRPEHAGACLRPEEPLTNTKQSTSQRNLLQPSEPPDGHGNVVYTCVCEKPEILLILIETNPPPPTPHPPPVAARKGSASKQPSLCLNSNNARHELDPNPIHSTSSLPPPHPLPTREQTNSNTPCCCFCEVW